MIALASFLPVQGPIANCTVGINMATRSQEKDWAIGDYDSFPSSLLKFCITSATSCFTSSGTGQNCSSFRLVSLASVLLLLSSLLLLYQRCKHPGRHPGHTVTSLYCFLGNVCGFTGAVLSRQLHIQVLMGILSAALDLVNVISCCIPLCLGKNWKTERRRRMIKKRRRSHFLAVCLLTALTGGFLKSSILHSQTTDRITLRRRLLSLALQDKTEVLGYIIGLISFVITFTSKLPTLCRVLKGKTLSSGHIFSGVLCSIGGALYAGALIHHGTQVSFLLRVMPWLLCAICGASLDFFIVVLYWCHVETRQKPMSFSPEMESLLGDSSKGKAAIKHNGKQGKHFNLMEMGHYMDVSEDATKEMYPREATVCGKVMDNKVLSRKVPMWDFETGNAQWSEAKTKPKDREAFPLQEWPSNPKPFNNGTYASCVLPQNGVSCNEAVSEFK
ncbi:transmembrane protein 44 isoform X2 [Corythoichthys intestinalis]|uniref:transmembrane protein 44 isoform X2 n=1 Tax=Corythoichthys intestinalis TaxID=161448 RepID=UPI0025A4CD14|nr:transmembrane protein 44 isoform X2 [Corythoichthys intestinalis]